MIMLRDDDSLLGEMAMLLDDALKLLGGYEAMGSYVWEQEIEAIEAQAEALFGQLWLRERNKVRCDPPAEAND